MKWRKYKGWYFRACGFDIGIMQSNAFRIVPEIYLGELHGKRVVGQRWYEVFWAFLSWRGWIARQCAVGFD